MTVRVNGIAGAVRRTDRRGACALRATALATKERGTRMGSEVRSTAVIVIIGLLVLAGGPMFVIYALPQVLDSISDVIFAATTGAFGILSAVLVHVMGRQRELEASKLAEKRMRYAEILDSFAGYVRSHGDDDDRFVTAVMHSYVFGSPRVAMSSYELIHTEPESRTHALDALVRAMRTDLGMPDIDDRVTTRGSLPNRASAPGTA